MREESLKYPLHITCLPDRTDYAARKEDCIQVLQGEVAWDILEEEVTTRIGSRRPRQSSTDPRAIQSSGILNCGISGRMKFTHIRIDGRH